MREGPLAGRPRLSDECPELRLVTFLLKKEEYQARGLQAGQHGGMQWRPTMR